MEPINTRDVYTIVTNQIIAQLENNIVPWKQPWKMPGLPRNMVTRRPYRGINLVLLRALDYPSIDFLTFRQVQDLGGSVKKGEKAHLVCYWLWHDEETDKRKHQIKAKQAPTLRYYHVFNASQCTGIPLPAEPAPIPLTGQEACNKIVDEMPNKPVIRHNLNGEAWYDASLDLVNVPPKETFINYESYASVLFHELVHSTGHPFRLNRKELVAMTTFGSELYSIEELTAEIGTCYLTAHAGIVQEVPQNNVAYIQGWLTRLRKDMRFIVYASAHAQKAADYILNIRHEESDVIDHLQAPAL